MTSKESFDALDAVARRMRSGDISEYNCMSTGERLYVALAANRPDLILAEGYRWSMVGAIARLGPEWLQELIERWRYQ